jgi:CDP-glucose 4,6-dehydratase
MNDDTPLPAGHDPSFWAGRRVLVTGHTGFKGSWLTTYLVDLGADVMGVSLPGPASEPSLWDALGLDGVHDLRADVAEATWQGSVVDFSPDIVLHLAAQALVSVGYDDPLATFRSNTLGTMNLMALLGSLPDLEAALVITTDKVYDTRQEPPYDEACYLGGDDPYAASKAAAELVVRSWPHLATTAPVAVATARAGNVIGGGDWSDNRIVPDLVRCWSASEELVLRRPDAVRPWQHVIEPLVGYLAYCEALVSGLSVPSALNFGPGAADAVSVGELVEYAAGAWAALLPDSAPTWRSEAPPAWHETGRLVLDASASKQHLGLENRWDWRQAMAHTLEWYVRRERGEPARALVLEQFSRYFHP